MSKNYPQITQILGRDALRRVRFSKEQLHLVTKPSLERSRSLAQDKSFTDAQEHIPIENLRNLRIDSNPRPVIPLRNLG
jgi:hypothetical protein